jgi:cytochrome oxidase assembly protein ShyY1
MLFDFENPHTVYVLAAYGVAVLGYAGIALHAYLKARAVKRVKHND